MPVAKAMLSWLWGREEGMAGTREEAMGSSYRPCGLTLKVSPKPAALMRTEACLHLGTSRHPSTVSPSGVHTDPAQLWIQ